MAVVEAVLAAQEVRREQRTTRWPESWRMKLRWRAQAMRHFFHVVPGERILEIGAGSGLWTELIARELRFENPVTAAVFSEGFAEQLRSKQIPNTTVVRVRDLESDLPSGSFDYVIGSSIALHEELPALLARVHRLLKPGGQVLFIEANVRFPGRRLWQSLKRIGGKGFHAPADQLVHAFSHQGFTHITALPYDLLSVQLGAGALRFLQAKMLVIERAPVVRNFCRSFFISARVHGPAVREMPNLAEHRSLHNTVSVVVPCRNEAPNLPRLVDRLLTCYGDYIQEILLVNDNSTDATREEAERLGLADSRVKVLNRTAPGGVGRALRDGYRAARGRYILSMDCDFIEIVPEFRGLFDAVANGYDGAIGSRFSHDCVLMNYPFFKMVCNRGLHLLVKVFLHEVRDVTNNLKLYRAEILKNLNIESPHFSANLETGLKPLLAGYRLREVPVSWIDRTVEMGSSSFDVRKVGADYARTLVRIWTTSRKGRTAWFSGGLNEPAVSA
jgi:ubiquinone/menaquinone biosynthesis C-methylase UbiE